MTWLFESSREVALQSVEKRRVSLWLAPFSTAFAGKRDAYPTFFNRLLVLCQSLKWG